MLKELIAAAALSCAAATALAGIDGRLEFSLDEGKTWSQDFPIMKSPGRLDVKLIWAAEETRPVEAGVVTAKAFSRERDFASANRGKQNWDASSAWYQDTEPGYAGIKEGKPFVVKLDLRARAEGVSGRLNKWSAEKKAFEDAPLPACSAFAPGCYRFSVAAGYTLTEGRQRVSLVKDFQVTIDGDAKQAQAASSKEETKAKAAPQDDGKLPELSGLQVFGVEKLIGKAKPPQGPLARAEGKDLFWRLDAIEAGDYNLRLLVESGNGHGEDQLALNQPWLYLNGTPVHFNRASGLSFFKGGFFAIIESDGKVSLEPGDQLRWNRQRKAQFGALALAKEPLPSAPIWVEQFTEQLSDDLYRIEGSFNGKLSASIANVSGKAQRLKISTKILDYFQNEVFAKESVEELPDGGKLSIESPQIADNGSDRFRAIAKVSDDSGKSKEKVFNWLSGTKEGARPVLWLNEGWEWTSLPDDGTPKTRTLQPLSAIPAKAEWRKQELPASWQDFKPNDHVAFFRKSFEAPEALLKAGRATLRFSRIAYEADVYLNGERIGSSSVSSYIGAAEFEIGGKLKPGQNEIELCIRGKVAALEQQELAKRELNLNPDSKIRAPIGLAAGIDEVRIAGSPATALGEIAVACSWRERKLSAEFDAPALPGGIVSSRVLFLGKELLRLPDAKTGAAAAKLKVEQTWEKPLCWGPDEFPLLQLEVELKDAAGKAVDRNSLRFGFREIWAEGMEMKWNGKAVKFASRPFMSTWGYSMSSRNKRDLNRDTIRMAKTLGCKMLRHIYNPESFADLADEEGMLIAEGLAGMAGHTRQQLESDEFWGNVASNAASGVMAMRDHPSIFTWYLSNEYFGESEDRCSQRLAEYGRKIKALDPSRFVEFGCDIDLRGVSDIMSIHYPVDLSAFRTPEAYLPESAYWRRFDQSFSPGMKVPAGMCKKSANIYADSPLTWGRKPIVVNECCWISFFNPPDGLTSIASDWVYSSPSAVSIAHTMANRWFGYGHRDVGSTAITMWKHLSQDPAGDSLPETDIDVLQRYSRLYAGTPLKLDVNLIHDRFKTETLRFSATLSQNGKAIDKRSEDILFDYCQLKRLKLDFTMPDVKAKSSLKLKLELSLDGKAVCEKTVDYVVYPPSLRNVQAANGIGLLSNSAELQIELPGAKKVSAVKDLAGLDKIFIGGDIDIKSLEAWRDALLSFAAEGGNVILLERDFVPDWLPGSLKQTGRISSIGYSFRPSHAYVEGLDEGDLSFWHPEHKISGQCLRKPSEGNFRSVIESGGPDGLIYCALGTIAWGKGQFTLCQLHLDAERNPIAAIILGNMVKAAPQKPGEQAGFIGPSDTPLRKTLLSLGAAVKEIQTPSEAPAAALLIVDASKGIKPELAAALRAWTLKGGTLLLHGATPENAEAASSIAGAKLEIEQIKAQAWQGRALRLGFDPVSEGLTNFDLFWRKRPETEGYGGSFFLKKEVAADLGEWTVAGQGVKPLLYPALLSAMSCGKGRIVFDNLNWSEASPAVKESARRIASTLLTNLGAELAPSRKPRLPEKLSYTALNMSSILNRSFADEVENDGVGGWSDQGPEADLRNFKAPAGTVKFNDVPFRIERPLSCLVLSSRYRKGGAESATLNVGAKADALFFLQSCAWTSPRLHASAFVEYEDGSSYEIKFAGDVNLRDWTSSAPEAPFNNEVDTITSVATTVKQDKYGKASLFQTAWINPTPAKAIKDIVFKSAGNGVPVFVAATLGMKSEEVQAKASGAAELKRAAKAALQAAELQKAGKAKDAEALLRGVLKDVPDSPDAWLQLGYLLEERSQFNEAIEAYRAANRHKPQLFEPRLRIGKCHEALGEFQKAAETYREALRYDINQPDVMAALEAVKKKL